MDNQIEKLTFKNIIMSIGAIPSSYVDSMSYYETLVWLCNYLQETVIPTVNNNGEAVEELQGLYIELQNYVDTYFDNLDVQEEINNKLDEMAEDGTLTNLIKNYVDPLFDTLSDEIHGITNTQNETINTFITNTNNQLTNFQSGINSQMNDLINEVDSKNAGTPLVASSTSEMTDTDHVYVNTTDGKWYYYNNNQWNIGGTYQSTGLGEKSVGYINESDILRFKFKKITADDILWRFYSVVNGELANSSTVITSQCFLCPKGSTINMANGVQGRITIYNLDKTYNSNTGAFSNIQNYTVANDCYIRISMNYISGDQVALTDGNSTNVQFTGLLPINCGSSIVNSLQFTQYTSSYWISQHIYVNKGTKIILNDGDLLNSSGNDANAILNFCVREGNQSKDPTAFSNYQHTTYTVQNDGFIQIFIAVGGAVTDWHLARINNAFQIELNTFESKVGVINAYIGQNAGLDIQAIGSGAIAVKLNGNLVVFNSNIRTELAWSDMKTALSSNVVTINGEDYISIPQLSTFNYNLNNSSFEIKAYNTGSVAVNTEEIILLSNGVEQPISGILLDLYNKDQSINGDSERLNKQLFNSCPFIKNYDWKTNVTNYTKKLISLSENVEKYFFFTDQHLLGSGNTFTEANEKRLRDYMGSLQKVYNSTPADYIVSGGDWLIDGDTQEVASFKLGYMDGFTKSMFKNYYPVLGNHDTNYQGKLDPSSAANTGTFDNDTIINLMFNNYDKLYYSFDGKYSKNYVLDTQIDWVTEMDSYKWNQINWLGTQLLNDDPEHSIIFMHIIWNDITSEETLPFTDNVTKLIEAFNHKTIVQLNGITYNFTNTTGHVDYILGGHVHTDHHDWINNILCIATTTFALSQSTPTYDMIINDYDNNKAYFIRVGAGESREFVI